MKNGIGSPYVKVFTSLGEVTSNITDFVYKYSQKEDDTCQLRVEDGVPGLADKPEFQEGAILTVVWGYMGEDPKGKRKIIVKNVKATFEAKNICLDLLCADSASRIKGTSSRKIHKGTLATIGKDIADKNGLKFVAATIDEEGQLAVDAWKHIDERRPGFIKEDGNYTTQIDNVAVVKDMKFRVYDQLPQANKSDYHILKEATDNDPNGPFEVYGRDDALHVVKKNLNQKPLRAYTYGDKLGLVISFYPESKEHTRKQSASNVNTTAFNPETKTAYDINTNEFTNDMTKLGEITDMPPRVSANGISDGGNSATQKNIDTGDGAKQAVLELLARSKQKSEGNNADQPSNKNKLSKISDDNKKPANSEVGTNSDYKTEPADTFEANYALKKDFGLINFSIYNTESPTFVNQINQQFTSPVDATSVVKLVKPIDYNRSMPSSEHSVESAYAKAKGHQANAALNKNPAELKVVGDPLIESGKVVTILGVSKKYSGNYYIDECEHKIKHGSPYLVEMKLSKNALGKTTVEGPTKVSVSSIDSPKLTITKINREVKPIKNGNVPYKSGNLLELLAASPDNNAPSSGAGSKW